MIYHFFNLTLGSAIWGYGKVWGLCYNFMQQSIRFEYKDYIDLYLAWKVFPVSYSNVAIPCSYISITNIIELEGLQMSSRPELHNLYMVTYRHSMNGCGCFNMSTVRNLGINSESFRHLSFVLFLFFCLFFVLLYDKCWEKLIVSVLFYGRRGRNPFEFGMLCYRIPLM